MASSSRAFPTSFLLLAAFSTLDISIINYTTRHGSGRSKSNLRTMYERWLVAHRKNYNALGEKQRRFEILKEYNLRFVDEHNSVDGTYKVGLNRFADLSNEEYRARFLGVSMEKRKEVNSSSSVGERYLLSKGDDLPESIDWHQDGVVAPIKDEGLCS